MVRRALLVVALSATAISVPTAASAGGGGCLEVTQGSGTTVEIRYSCITPTLLRVEPGADVTFVNRDDYRHVITGSGVAWASDGYMGSGEAFTATFPNDGVYPFQCWLHPGMAGAVVVGDATGMGAADAGGVFVAPFEAPDPVPEKIVFVTRDPEIRPVRSTGSAMAWSTGIAVGIAAGALAALAGSLLLRRRRPEVRG